MNENAMKSSGFGIGELGSTPASTPLDDIEAARLSAPKTPPRMVACDCGHTVPSSWVMSASRGTACPDCYDAMSDF